MPATRRNRARRERSQLPGRWFTFGFVVILLALSAGAPALTPRATAAPTSVTVAVYPVTPFAMKNDDRLSGFTIDLWNEIAERLGWTTNYVEVPSLPAQLDAVSAGRADLAAGAVSITAEREAHFDFSQPYLDAGLQIIVPARTAEPSTAGLPGFLKLLFSKSMLVWLGAALVISIGPAHVLWLVERRRGDSEVSRSYFPGIFQAFAWGLGILAANSDSSPRHWAGRAMSILWAFVSIIFVAYYTATLTATLTVTKLTTPIQRPADLYGRAVATVANTSSAAYLRQLGVTARELPTIQDCYRALTGKRADAVVYDAPVLRFYIAHDGAGVAITAGPVFHDENYGFAFPLGSDLRKPVDKALLQVREDGTYGLIEQKWLGDAMTTSADRPG